MMLPLRRACIRWKGLTRRARRVIIKRYVTIVNLERAVRRGIMTRPSRDLIRPDEMRSLFLRDKPIAPMVGRSRR